MNDPLSGNDDGVTLESLFTLARSQRVDTSRAEYGFETRLMARLHSRMDDGTVWALVSWRLIPFFAACVVAVTLWQTEMASDTSEAAVIASLNNPVAADLWAN